MTIRAGLCSVTLRSLSADEVIRVAAANGLSALEWGGDVHLPPGDEGRATRLARQCADAGLDCASYGSYFFAGHSPQDEATRVLDTAAALGAANVRVWCAFGVRPDAGASERALVAESLSALMVDASERGLSVSLEYHQNTLTETAASAVALLDAVGSPDLFTYWQPITGREPLADLTIVADNVSHMHVFCWRDDGSRLPLAEGADLWPAAFASLGQGRWTQPRVALLEFVRDDDPAQLAADAATLRAWL